MASSGNFCTLNPSLRSVTAGMNGGTFSVGNLKYAMSGEDGFRANYAMTHKTYCEVYINSISNYGGTIGFGSYQNKRTYEDMITFQMNYQSGRIYHYKGSSSQSVSIANIGGTVSATNVVMMAYDPATYKWWVGVNGTWRNSGDPANGTGFVFQGSSTMFEDMQGVFWAGWKGSANGLTCHWNFGQDSTFSGTITAGGNADENGFGDFKYTPPTGFLALCSGNQVISDDIDPAQTNDNFPQKQFNPVLYTGNGSDGHAITGVGFQPDLVWLKKRSASASHQLYDSSRGTGKLLSSNNNDAEATYSTVLQSFDSDGFTLGTSAAINGSSATMVGWCWRANGGTTASNSDGSITSTVQANQAAGFSIIQYTGTASNADFGHGLTKAPEFILVKNRDAGQDWRVYHVSVGASKHLVLNTSDAEQSNANVWRLTPTTSVIYIGTAGTAINGSGADYICYAWHGVDGYSKFGSFEGNLNSDGPFIYTGFRPRMLFIKDLDAGNEWYVVDTARNPNNPTDKFSEWDTSDAEQDKKLDILSNGFKPREDSARFNDTHTYVYGAWGDVPFKYNNTR